MGDKFNRYWEQTVIACSVVLFVAVLVINHALYRRARRRRAAAERSYLLHTANQEYEDQENQRAFGGMEYGSNVMDISVKPTMAEPLLGKSLAEPLLGNSYEMQDHSEYSLPQK